MTDEYAKVDKRLESTQQLLAAALSTQDKVWLDEAVEFKLGQLEVTSTRRHILSLIGVQIND